jgi:hypothetical protein
VTLNARDPKATEYICTLNGKPVEGWLFASEESCIIYAQPFPPGWVPEDGNPPEYRYEGNVKFERKLQNELPGFEW